MFSYQKTKRTHAKIPYIPGIFVLKIPYIPGIFVLKRSTKKAKAFLK